MNRVLFFGLLVVLMMALAACGGEPVDSAYTASGDGSQPKDLTPTTNFKPDDDLNVVISLNTHDYTLPIRAVFTAPDGTTFPTDTLEADNTVPRVLLGLDWEARGSTPWAAGDWQVTVYVNEDAAQTLNFTVQDNAADTAPANAAG